MLAAAYSIHLPEPLDEGSEREAVSGLDTEKGVLFRKRLIEHNLRLVMQIAVRYRNSSRELEDLFMEGTIGLIKAVDTLDREREGRLYAYASRCIENEIRMFLRRCPDPLRETPLYMDLFPDEPVNPKKRKIPFEEYSPGPEERILKKTEMDALREVLKSLPEKEKKILFLRFGIPETGSVLQEKQGVPLSQKEAAALMGVSQSYFSRMERRLLSDLRRKLQSGRDMETLRAPNRK